MAERERKRKKTNIGVLFWIASILFVLVVFLFNRANIESVLESTGLLEVLGEQFSSDQDEDTDQTNIQEEPTLVLPVEDDSPQDNSSDPSSDNGITRISQDNNIHETTTVEDPLIVERQEENSQSDSSDNGSNIVNDTEPSQNQTVDLDNPEVNSQQEFARSREFDLFFLKVSNSGSVSVSKIQRNIGFNSSPLTQTIKALISGPVPSEENDGFINLIPNGTELLSAWVNDGVAYLNFNDTFQFNTMGLEGYKAQVQQIVYSTVQFPTVNQVQILIEGKQVDFLGGDGIYIGKPIDASSLGG